MRRMPTWRSLGALIVGLSAGLLLCSDARHDSRAEEPGQPVEMTRFAFGPDELRASYQRAAQGGRSSGEVYKAKVTPHWFGNNTRFWYRNDLAGGTREFILVDAEKGTRVPAFDHQRLAAALSKAATKEFKSTRLPFDTIEFVDDAKALRFTVDKKAWKCDLASYDCAAEPEAKPPSGVSSPAPEESTDPAQEEERQEAPRLVGLLPEDEPTEPVFVMQRPPRPMPSDTSPDGNWTAFIKESNLFIRDKAGKETQLTNDGKANLAYGLPSWAADSKALVAFRIEPGEKKEVYLIESSPREGGRARLRTRSYDLPGDRFTSYEMHLFDPANAREIKCAVDKIDFGFPSLRWQNDSHRFSYQKTDRGHQRFRLVEVDALTGTSRNLIDEKTDTFIWSAHAESVKVDTITWLDKTDEILYASEKDGWRHLYLVDAREGKIKNQITRGDYVVRNVDRIDEANREIWFRASGRNAGQDPYFIHYYRVHFDGTGLVALTEGNGTHTVAYSPDRRFLIDTYSRIDLAPVHELRRAEDGKLVCKLEEADTSALEANGWEAPEVFVAKGRDGKTDIWGIINRPRKLDPTKKYPVIEYIYAGPHDSHVPKAFSAARRFSALTELGFIVVQMDGMGTANRSKAFHDVCWKNLKDAGFPDRILWHQAAGRKYPYYDVSRVGIYGTSAGGQNSTGALLFHGDFYKAAVSACGCHDNRMDKASWNEQWMGYPVGPQYAASSNIDHAGNLKGKLLLIVGEVDINVPPESTLRLADALIKAGKDFDFLMVPGMGHSDGGLYGRRRLQDFFVRHLHGVEPPDRNAPRP